jgi:hypothetical protein
MTIMNRFPCQSNESDDPVCLPAVLHRSSQEESSLATISSVPIPYFQSPYPPIVELNHPKINKGGWCNLMEGDE